ncbi:MAG: hypothetical protein WCW16_01850 [Candidatus Magasanikbacteria bacterium]
MGERLSDEALRDAQENKIQEFFLMTKERIESLQMNIDLREFDIRKSERVRVLAQVCDSIEFLKRYYKKATEIGSKWGIEEVLMKIDILITSLLMDYEVDILNDQKSNPHSLFVRYGIPTSRLEQVRQEAHSLHEKYTSSSRR